MSRRGERSRRYCQRAGAVAAEFALALPPLVLIVLASVEACNALSLNHTTTIVAYEGIRMAVDPDGTNATALAQCNLVLASRSIQDVSIEFDPLDVASAQAGDLVTVTVSAPFDVNAISPRWFFAGRRISSSVTMVKE